ncbi:tRNA G37 N-methylase TrmD [Bradyrhizobium yuanmingense]|uniref:tRNA G37 N-methylase TrmD n=1 Tax=Bradyrhizobium yuanmingense TaxID=108015 RepID=A0ABV4GF56_9BRAD
MQSVSGIVDEHVEPAEGLDRFCDRGLGCRRIGHVQWHGDHAAVERLGHILDRLDTAGRRDDLIAALRRREREPLAEAA